MSNCACDKKSVATVSVDGKEVALIAEECLAHILHEAGREAVLAGNTVAAEKFGDKPTTFIEWDDCSENVKEGRRIQARFLLKKLWIINPQTATPEA
jgi:hypothetical protein